MYRHRHYRENIEPEDEPQETDEGSGILTHWEEVDRQQESDAGHTYQGESEQGLRFIDADPLRYNHLMQPDPPEEVIIELRLDDVHRDAYALRDYILEEYTEEDAARSGLGPPPAPRDWQPQFEARDDHSLVDTRTGEIIDPPEAEWESLIPQPEERDIYDPEYGTDSSLEDLEGEEEEPYVAEVHGQGYTATVAEFTDTSGLIYFLHSEQAAPAADDNPDQAWAQEAEADQAARELVVELEEDLEDRLTAADEHAVMDHLMESKPVERLGAYLEYELGNEMERSADADDDDEEW